MLDHELVQHSERATNNGFPSLSTEVLVRIYILEMNDTSPVFNQLIYESFT